MDDKKLKALAAELAKLFSAAASIISKAYAVPYPETG